MKAPGGSLPGVDALKVIACVLIVWHHLAFYGPMSDVVFTVAPSLINWLYDYGRMAVQVFLVVGGYLAAASLAPQGMAALPQPGRVIVHRYRRLVLPLLVALLFTTVVAALVRPWLLHPSVPGVPTPWQVIAHVFLLQDLVGQEALSAGVWYVAIDFQLFVLSVALFMLVQKIQTRWPEWTATSAVGPLLVLVLTSLSLFYFNRNKGMDMTGAYFFGAYGLGMLACWASRTQRLALWLPGIAVLGTVALAQDFRGRLLVALLVALLLVGLQRGQWAGRWLQAPWLATLGRMSYSVFLIHFPVLLLVNAGITHFWPANVLVNAGGMLLAFLLSVLAGAGFHRFVEGPVNRHQHKAARLIPAAFVSP